MLNEHLHQILQAKCIGIIGKDLSLKIRMKEICSLLHKEVGHYDWIGFYLKNGEKDELILGPFVGKETEHKLIPYGSGVCGRAAVEERTILIEDVSKEENYLACNLSTKSELVVPIIKNGVFIAQLDVDSNELSAFTIRDKILIQAICRRFAEEMD